MERDLILLALQEFLFRDGKDLKEVQQYLRMKHRIEAEELVLKRRLEKLLQAERAVA